VVSTDDPMAIRSQQSLRLRTKLPNRIGHSAEYVTNYTEITPERAILYVRKFMDIVSGNIRRSSVISINNPKQSLQN
jgi:hypothetical protein